MKKITLVLIGMSFVSSSFAETLARPTCHTNNRVIIGNACSPTHLITYSVNQGPAKVLPFGQTSLKKVCQVDFGSDTVSGTCAYNDGTGKPVVHNILVSCSSNGGLILTCIN